MSLTSTPSDEELWLFGYGSLIWKPPPHFDRRVPGYILNYVRRFWQASEDHRGTPSSPGRVVTLIERSYWETLAEKISTDVEPDRVYGVAYRIPPQHVKEVKSYLDIREINGYSIQFTTFHPLPPSSPTTTTDTSTASLPRHSHSNAIDACMVYIGLPTNPQFLGLQPPDSVARVISISVGPSGTNAEYLFMLEEALEGLSASSGDEHVKDLSQRVRGLVGKESAMEVEIRDKALGVEAERKRSGEGGNGEETEKVE